MRRWTWWIQVVSIPAAFLAGCAGMSSDFPIPDRDKGLGPTPALDSDAGAPSAPGPDPNHSTPGGADGAGGAGSPAGSAAVSGASVGAGGKAAPDCMEVPATPITFSKPRAQAMSSAGLSRSILQNYKKAPAAAVVRPDEFLNYYPVTYPTTGAPNSKGLTVVASLEPEGGGDYLLQVGVQAAPNLNQRRKTVLTIVVDTSSSMGGPGPETSMQRAIAAVQALASSLNKDDVVNVLTTNPAVKPITQTAAVDHDTMLAAMVTNTLKVDGAGGLQGAVTRAYAFASAGVLMTGNLNRVVLITDGAEATTIDPVSVGAAYTSSGIALVGVGVGAALAYNDGLLEAATRAGHGADVYLGSVVEAKALGERFDAIVDVAAREVKVMVTMPGAFQPVDIQGSGYTSDPGALVASDLAPGGSMIFRQQLRSSCPAGADNLAIQLQLSWIDPITGLPQSPAVVTQLISMTMEPSFQVKKASAILAYADALHSVDAHRLGDAYKLVTGAQTFGNGDNQPRDKDDKDLIELVQLIHDDPLFTP